MYNRTVAILAANPAFSSIFGGFLTESGGYKVPCFERGAALQTFLRIAPVQVVVIDEGGESIETIRAVRAHPRLAYPDPAIVVMTRARPVLQDHFRAAGADVVLEKPVGHARLADEVHRLFALAGRRRLPLASGEGRGRQFTPHAKVISLEAWKRTRRRTLSSFN